MLNLTNAANQMSVTGINTEDGESTKMQTCTKDGEWLEQVAGWWRIQKYHYL